MLEGDRCELNGRRLQVRPYKLECREMEDHIFILGEKVDKAHTIKISDNYKNDDNDDEVVYDFC